ncbi:enoyl-CoA hydratase/isomerase family protein [Zavarzinia sp. CC-PAN008]|uniref:enoyl-CoA hydratase/isomerase family protein n=1 Tax=Zavarzinia sp. CC-PAN008 TaxID=3243332 RepID=UPI003F74A9FE
MHQPILLDIDGPVARITLNRPEKHNSLGVDDLALFEQHLDAIALAEGIRVVILSGGRSRSFCSGASLGELGVRDWSKGPLERVVERLEAVRVPVIASLNGGVFGGGVEVALACDFRIGVHGMRAFVPPARIGIHYPVSGLHRFVERLGLNVAKRLLLAAEEFDDAEILRVGLVDRLVDPAALDASVGALAERLAGLAPLSLAGMKASLNAIARGTLDEGAAHAAMAACFASADFREGLAAHAEKRKPRFEGR